MFVIASHNPTKTKVIQDALRAEGLETISASTLDLIEPPETGTTLLENATLKAKAAMEATGLPAIADDSGLFMPTLDGGPGVYTADLSFTKNGRDWSQAMHKIHDSVMERGATFPLMGAFVATLVIALPDGSTHVFTDEQGGNVVWPPQGTGFALDPIFQPYGAAAPLSMLSQEESVAYNHRHRAASRAAKWLKSYCVPATSTTQVFA